ncbi:MAG: alpha/beta hydrolase [Devosia sp.]
MADAPYDAFNVAAILPDFDELFAQCKVASNAVRARYRSQLDVPYGPEPRNRIDLFFPPGEAGKRPIHLFIHGGYWRGQMKEDYALVAEGAIAAGAICAIVEYTLMPDARMAQLVAEVRAAATWLYDHADEFGGDPARISASGHSAGAHLCSFLVARSPHERHLPETPIQSVLLLSGLYDLRPITTSYLQPTLQLSPEEVAHWSPFEAVPASGTHFEIVVGHNETAPFHLQAQDYAYALERHGVSRERITAAGHDHMSLVLELGQPGKPLAELLRAAVERG